MNWYKMIDGWYNSVPKRWTISMVRDAVIVGKITEQEFFEITGEPFTPVEEPTPPAEDPPTGE